MLKKNIIFHLVLISSQLSLSFAADSCESRITCEKCIRDPSLCVWCAMEENFNSTIRCKSQSSYQEEWCPKHMIQNPDNDVKASKTKNFNSTSDNVIQIKPQQYKLKLRPGMPAQFNFTFKAAENFPVDLYFLLDASKTMNRIKKNTADRSENIYSVIKKMTNNIRLGLGTFVDKRLLPFADKVLDENLTYSFRHRLKLIDDFKKLKEMMIKTPIGENRDEQEGGLDALAQVMTCKDIIGWRNESRKIVVFLTDGPYHAAGDGKIAGLFQPYDGKCYTENNSYTKEREMDYPSVGMINKLAIESDIIVIFLVSHDKKNIYRSLSKVVSGSKYVTFNKKTLKVESDAIVNTLKKIYERISQRIQLKVTAISGRKKKIQISFKPDCTGENSGSECDIEVGKEHEFVGTIKLLEYDDSNNTIIDVAVEGIGEKLTLDIDVIKNCECENHVVYNSTFCHGEKRLCGICSCSKNRYGDKCACERVVRSSESTNATSNNTCIAEGDTDVCSGHGSCVCGTCQCRSRFEGKFCECNMDSCPRGAKSGAICNGHGKCYCGKCTCDYDWSGDACDCNTSDDDCKGDDGSICYGRGRCQCGGCSCDQIDEWDARRDHDLNCKIKVCTDCHELQCRKLEAYAKCRHYDQKDCTFHWRVKTKVVEVLPEEYLNNTAVIENYKLNRTTWKVCDNVKVGVGCYTKFVYRYNDTDYSLDLIVTNEKDCAENHYLFGGVSLLVLLLVGAGTLIAWKLLTEARDRHEYMQFMQKNKQGSSGPCKNPLYESPTTTFKNPTYRKKSVDFR